MMVAYRKATGAWGSVFMGQVPRDVYLGPDWAFAHLPDGTDLRTVYRDVTVWPHKTVTRSDEDKERIALEDEKTRWLRMLDRTGAAVAETISNPRKEHEHRLKRAEADRYVSSRNKDRENFPLLHARAEAEGRTLADEVDLVITKSDAAAKRLALKDAAQTKARKQIVAATSCGEPQAIFAAIQWPDPET